MSECTVDPASDQASPYWPEPFVTGEIPAETGNKADTTLCAYALCAWALCMAGNKPPAKFGVAMVKISRRLGITRGGPDVFSQLAKKRWPDGLRIED
mgnify:CR=1 FL=1